MSLGLIGSPIVVPKGRKKAVNFSTWTVFALIGVDIRLVVLSNIIVDRLRLTIGIVVISRGDDQFRFPTFYQGGDVGFWLACQPKITDYRKTGRCRFDFRNSRRCYCRVAVRWNSPRGCMFLSGLQIDLLCQSEPQAESHLPDLICWMCTLTGQPA